MKKIILFGAGRMGTALLTGWLAEGVVPAEITIVEPSPGPAVRELMAHHGVRLASLRELIAEGTQPAIAVLAVKPQVMDELLTAAASLFGPDTLVLSIAAGRTIDSLARHLSASVPIARAMPNTPAAIGRGYTVVVGNEQVTPAHIGQINQLLKAGGGVTWIEDEMLMDAVTALSGSGPAYIFHMTECLTRAGVALGLDPALAAELARHTVSGAGALMQSTDETPAALREAVTSPGGTTAAALAVLMGNQNQAEDAPCSLQSLMTRALQAAERRSRELADMAADDTGS